MGALLQEGVRSMLFDNVERVMEWGQITLCVKIAELFILSYYLTLEYCRKNLLFNFFKHLVLFFYNSTTDNARNESDCGK